MPRQRTLFGRAINPSRRLPPRRIIWTAVIISLFIVSALFITAPTAIPIPAPSEVGWYNPFGPAVHKPPPIAANSSSGDASWLPNWNWLNPFSSTLTLDENRSVLPPRRKRPPIYTFYDTSIPKDDATKDAEHRLLRVWRRAWWAQGFRPVVLDRAEALRNPMYQRMQSLKLGDELEADVVRWLAWSHMGAGILVDKAIFPMGPYEDSLLSFLRRGDYPRLRRYGALGSALLSGPKPTIDQIIKIVFDNPMLKSFTTLLDAVPSDAAALVYDDPENSSIAYYSADIIARKYKTLASVTNSYLISLPQLVNAHLHTTFQNSFSSGITVLKPLPEHTTALVSPALQIATLLVQCPVNPIVHSCPPNKPKCKPCSPVNPLPVSISPIFDNTTTIYTIGTVPHPYTLLSLTTQRDNLDKAFVRRRTARDQWIAAATKGLLGTGLSGARRVVKLKEAVAGEWGASHSLWLSPEDGSPPKDLYWHFGFSLPEVSTAPIEARPPVPGKAAAQDTKGREKDAALKLPSAKELGNEERLLGKAREAIKSKVSDMRSLKAVVEAWNLADTEAWRFTRAFNARARVERLKWEEEERGFAGGTEALEGSGPSGWGRWFDKS